MIPIDFWASFPPCDSASAMEETIWDRLKKWFTCGVAPRVRKTDSDWNAYPIGNPTMGDVISTSTILTKPATLKCATPVAARTLPAIPPTSAWLDDDGRPNHHVKRFQKIAPLRAPMITHALITVGSTMSFPIVFATAVPKIKGPRNSQLAAMIRAADGDIDREAIIVATTFEASWNPFTKSKTMAIPITRTTR